MLRLIHTADWHLGQTLEQVPRLYEHERFLRWLLDTLAERRADALVVSGDVFDSANPPSSAQAMFYRFLADAAGSPSNLEIVIVAGNHDSPARLQAPEPILESLRVKVIGILPRKTDRSLDDDRLLVPLHDADGNVAAWCAAIPFLRPADLPRPGQESRDPLIEGVRQVYRETIEAARERRADGQSLIVTGHCYMVGTRISELSERKILGGNAHALPSDVFTAEVTYAALGHLHLAQSVGNRETVRYSGSPLPLSMAESEYPHQVLQVDLENSKFPAITSIPVPRWVDILRIPKSGPGPFEEVVEILSGLETRGDLPAERQPFLEVSVLLDEPVPSLRKLVEDAIRDKGVRLMKIRTSYAGREDALADTLPDGTLDEMHPVEVFKNRYRQKHDGDPSGELLDAFHEIVEEVHAGEENQ